MMPDGMRRVVAAMPHEVVPVKYIAWFAYDNRHVCGTCKRDVWWDGVFEGRWLHCDR